MPAKDIFLSYASEDRDRVGPLIHALETTGWTVFWDRTIPAGKTWRQAVGKALEDCRSMVVVWSRTSIDSDWVMEEADKGKLRGILVPVRIDEVEPPLGFSAIQAADLVGWDGLVGAPPFRRLVNDLRELLGNEPPPVKAAGETERVRTEHEGNERRRAEAPAAAREADRKAEEDSRRRAEKALRRTKEAEARPRVRLPVWKVAVLAAVPIAFATVILARTAMRSPDPVSTPGTTLEAAPVPTINPAATAPHREASEWHERGASAGDRGEKIRCFSEAIRLKPDYAEAYYDRGVAYEEASDFYRARYDLDEAIRLKPDYAEAYLKRGGLRTRMGDPNGGAADLQRYRDLEGKAEAAGERTIRHVKP